MRIVVILLKILLVLIVFGVLFVVIRPLFFKVVAPQGCMQADYNAFVSLPLKGDNYKAYSYIGYSLGRAYMREPAAAASVKAYNELALSHPDIYFIYGEIGTKSGGEFKPHKTHQDGLSADYITPMIKQARNGTLKRTNLSSNVFNLWTYRTRLDYNGEYKDMRMDTEAVILHLAALNDAAACFGLRISRVILDPPLQLVLREDPLFYMIADLNLQETQSWFPHDSHYHVDFVKAD